MSADSGVHVSIDRSDLEKEVAELRVQLCKASVRGEVEELKRALDCKERERVQLSLQLKVCASHRWFKKERRCISRVVLLQRLKKSQLEFKRTHHKHAFDSAHAAVSTPCWGYVCGSVASPPRSHPLPAPYPLIPFISSDEATFGIDQESTGSHLSFSNWCNVSLPSLKQDVRRWWREKKSIAIPCKVGAFKAAVGINKLLVEIAALQALAHFSNLWCFFYWKCV